MSKKTWKSLDVSLQFSTKSFSAQEDADAPLSDINSIRSMLPTKTNDTRQTAELDNIPENGPFILNFANMSFDATETDLRNFFHAYEIRSMEINGPRKGCGHIEFTNLQDLSGAWKMNDKIFINRPLKLSIPLKDDAARQQASGYKPKFQSQQKMPTISSDDSENWRVKRTPPSAPQTTVHKDGGAPTLPRKEAGDQSGWRTSSVREKGSAWSQNRPGASGMPHASVDADADNWRKTRNTEGRSSVREEKIEARPVVVAEEPRDGKKKSIFGEARPVDTKDRDIEIEAKIEAQSKKVAVTIDTTTPKSQNVWATPKKPSPAPLATTPATGPLPEPTTTTGVPEWRDKTQARLRPLSEHQRDTQVAPPAVAVPVPAPAAVVPRPAPPPAINVWTERKKSRNTAASEAASVPLVTVLTTVAATTTGSVSTTTGSVSTTTGSGAMATVPVTVDTTTTTVLTTVAAAAAAVPMERRPPPVVISANGPFLDPRSRRTPPHPTTTTATAVSMDTATTACHSRSPPPSQPNAVPVARGGARPASVWAKGPPKGLIDHPAGVR